MNTTETNRHEFEERFSHFDLSRNPLNGIYLDYGSEGAWKGWQAARERQWMPIESAPKDRTEILTLHLQFGLLITRWLGSREMWQGWAVIPTYWMPLPNPPTNPNEL
jgi:hypothetical protein